MDHSVARRADDRRYPAEVGSYTNSDGIHSDFTTLAELFQAHGFATASFNTHALLVGVRGGFRQGFDTVYPTHVKPILEGEHKMPFSDTEPHLMEWLAAHTDVPFFVWIHDMDPHLPTTTGNPYLKTGGWTRYDAEVHWMDEAMGRVLDRLRALGLGKDLLVVFTADHGEAFGSEHGLVGHQDVMYDEVLHVPLMVQYPTMGPPRRIAAPVELIDMYATIADLAGLPLPEARAARVVPLLGGVRPEREAVRVPRATSSGRHALAGRARPQWKLLALRSIEPTTDAACRNGMSTTHRPTSSCTASSTIRPRSTISMTSTGTGRSVLKVLSEWGDSVAKVPRASRRLHAQATPWDTRKLLNCWC